MSYLAILWRTEIRAVLAVALVALVLSVETWVQAVIGASGPIAPYDGARLVFLYVISVGTVVAIFYGAPLYALAASKRLASWYVALIIAVVPGAVLFSIERHELELALWITGSGLAVGLLTHLAMRKMLIQARSNSIESGPPSAAARRER
jgi:hypothetical protein